MKFQFFVLSFPLSFNPKNQHSIRAWFKNLTQQNSATTKEKVKSQREQE
jgi:hypothetical protein